MAAYPAYHTENTLFLRADAMLYEAKQGGRNRICPLLDQTCIPARAGTARDG
jgi:predicted signal transduction protein with EAL and GGDEF domain